MAPVQNGTMIGIRTFGVQLAKLYMSCNKIPNVTKKFTPVIPSVIKTNVTLPADLSDEDMEEHAHAARVVKLRIRAHP